MLVQLQYLRAVAAILVVCFHAILQFQKVDPTFLAERYAFGETGVDIFFVLSGFVMWLTTSGRAVTPGTFFWRRIKRIVPLYWLATLFSAAIALFLPSLQASTVFDLPHLVASLLFLPFANPADPGTITPVVVPGWTLNMEMFFYLLFALVLPLAEPRRLPALAGLFLVVLALCHILPETTLTRFYGQTIILEFLAGTCLGWLYCQRICLPSAWGWAAIALGAVFLGVNEMLEEPAARAYAWGIPAIFIVYGAVSIDVSRLPQIGWLGYLGDCSYAIYITHPFTLALARVLTARVSLAPLHHPLFFVLFCAALSILGGIVAHEMTKPRRFKAARPVLP